ncbi:4Fe-4S dicluster domain-containing protein [Desulfovirgula thermocuniculi]|uniref:4Fe-4S dicluster domain-containing protein n=1 Tax=Desulfovirgula thermocuniculi TaxID=348842 RepID=UPI000417F595|nr:4Fe-4S dicluster domain-containing protein [Desulfovirgula thermocuniculi]
MATLKLDVENPRELLEYVQRESGQPVEKCYQCGKCTAGCTVAFAFDLMPHQIMHMIRLGLREEILRAQSIWLCTTCVICTARCPQNIDVAAVMETLRILARRQKALPTGKARPVALFNRLFLDSIRKHGRLFELATMVLFNLKSGHLFREAETGWFMWRKGKLKLTPTRPRGTEEIERIFARLQEVEGEEDRR